MVGMWDMDIWEIEVKIILEVGQRVSKVIVENIWFFYKN